MTNHSKGRYCLEWQTGRLISIPGMRNGIETLVPETAMAVYQVTGKSNKVYVQLSTLGKGKWMKRTFFEHFVAQIKKNMSGVELKPTSKGWKPISAT